MKISSQQLLRYSLQTSLVAGAGLGAAVGLFMGVLTLDVFGVLSGIGIGAVMGVLLGPFVGWVIYRLGGATGGVSVGAYTGMTVGGFVGLFVGWFGVPLWVNVPLVPTTMLLSLLAEDAFQAAMLMAFLLSVVGMGAGAFVGGLNLKFRPPKGPSGKQK